MLSKYDWIKFGILLTAVGLISVGTSGAGGLGKGLLIFSLLKDLGNFTWGFFTKCDK